MNPSIVCNNSFVNNFDTTYEAFGDVVLTTDGVITSVLRCDEATSGAVNFAESNQFISADDFNVLWPMILGLFVTAYIVRVTVRMFDINPGRN
jgi:hypothetical protein